MIEFRRFPSFDKVLAEETYRLLDNSSIGFFVFLYEGLVDTRDVDFLRYIDTRMHKPIFVVRTKWDRDASSSKSLDSAGMHIEMLKFKCDYESYMSYTRIFTFNYVKESVYFISAARDARDSFELEKLIRDCFQLAESLKRPKSVGENLY